MQLDSKIAAQTVFAFFMFHLLSVSETSNGHATDPDLTT
jgi:hypothetical protein